MSWIAYWFIFVLIIILLTVALYYTGFISDTTEKDIIAVALIPTPP